VVAEGPLLVERAGLAGHRDAAQLPPGAGEDPAGRAGGDGLAHHAGQLLRHLLVDDAHRLQHRRRLAPLHQLHQPGRHQHALVGHHRRQQGGVEG
jgi:hypothetical protein